MRISNLKIYDAVTWISLYKTVIVKLDLPTWNKPNFAGLNSEHMYTIHGTPHLSSLFR